MCQIASIAGQRLDDRLAIAAEAMFKLRFGCARFTRNARYSKEISGE